VPCGLTKPRAGAAAGAPDAERLPVALEFVGLADRDERVLALAAAFQRLAPLLTDPMQLRSWAKSVGLVNN
jgi:Asp-tRNA(Asn)/Glu-tRNA(Gln) amidotransferase A subunit family amidase